MHSINVLNYGKEVSLNANLAVKFEIFLVNFLSPKLNFGQSLLLSNPHLILKRTA